MNPPTIAPLHVPLKRRLQTLAALIYGVEPSFVIGSFIYMWAFPCLWPLLIAYLMWMIKDQAPVRGGRRIEWVRRLAIWNYFAAYFPIRIIKVMSKRVHSFSKTWVFMQECDLDTTKKYLFG